MVRKSEAELELELVREELATLRLDYQRLERSSSYRLGKLLMTSLSSPRRLLSLPANLSRLMKEVRLQRRPPGPASTTYIQLQSAWRNLAAQARADGGPVIFLFSGTTFIQGTRGNRPIRQTQALLRQGAKVLFSYPRSRFDDPLPTYQQEGLVQMPQDVTLQLLREIASADLGSCPRLFIVSYPYPGMEQQVEVFRRHGWTVIYDCRDDWEEFAKVGMARWFDARVEQELVRQCDRTICVSVPLVRKMAGLASDSRVELVPNAVEADFLPDGYRHDPVEPPVIGYFGHLSDAWFDWDNFIEVAKRCSHYRFEVIGHSAPPGLQLPANVHLLGPKPWHQLHRYARHWRAAVIPFRMGRLADGVDPIKIYEYLSFGLPVVSFRMPQIEQYPYTTTVESVPAFCDALELACSTRVEQARIETFIAANTWEVRAHYLLGLMAGASS